MPRRSCPNMGNGFRHSPSRDCTLEKYIQLSTQQDNLRHRLSLTIPSTSPLSSSSPSETSPSSPHHPLYSPGTPTRSAYDYHNTFSAYLSSSVPADAISAAMASQQTSTASQDASESRLCDVNNQIKATLTELLNQDSVKDDDKFRHWVQDRLIEAEAEIRNQRRRSRRRSELEQDGLATTISESFRGSAGMDIGVVRGLDGVWRLGTTV